MTTQKEIASHLTMAARKASLMTDGATDKQVWFLAGLIAKAGETAEGVMYSGGLTKRQASSHIDDYLTEEKWMATGLSRIEARMKRLGA